MKLLDLKKMKPKPRSSQSPRGLYDLLAQYREVRTRRAASELLDELWAEAGSLQALCDSLHIKPDDLLRVLHEAGMTIINSIVPVGNAAAKAQRRRILEIEAKERKGKRGPKPLISYGLRLLDSQSESAIAIRESRRQWAREEIRPARVGVTIAEPYYGNLERISQSNNTSRHWVFNYLLATYLYGTEGIEYMGVRVAYSPSQGRRVLVYLNLLEELQSRSDGAPMQEAFDAMLPRLGALQSELWVRYQSRTRR